MASLALCCASMSAFGASLNCKPGATGESFRYNWRLRGGLSWVAGIMFPTSGVAELKTSWPTDAHRAIDSSLLITTPTGRTSFYDYETQIEAAPSQRTLMTYHAYAWKNKSRKERTLFDYASGVAHLHKETPEKQWDVADRIPATAFHDVISAIYYLRTNAAAIRGPLSTTIYSDGNSYPVIIRPADRRMFQLGNQQVAALGFEFGDAPGGKKWPGGMKIWVSDDARRIPFRIEIIQSMASLQLELQTVDACAFMAAK
jgi:hypothetical protein